MKCKTFDTPEEKRTVDKGKIDVVKLGDVTAMRVRFKPGWRWSECIESGFALWRRTFLTGLALWYDTNR